jgi:ABC-type uncharacterized transport system permease subunit
MPLAEPPTAAEPPAELPAAAKPIPTPEPIAARLPGPAERTPGWREVLIVAAVVVAVVLGASFITGFLPTAGQDFVFKTPLAIVVIVVGTVGLLARLARRPPVV